jgi:hypothetical protein
VSAYTAIVRVQPDFVVIQFQSMVRNGLCEFSTNPNNSTYREEDAYNCRYC